MKCNTQTRWKDNYSVLTIVSFLFLISIATPTVAQQPAQTTDWNKVHSLTMEAMNELYNLRFPESEGKCNEIIKLAPNDPRGHFFKAMTYYYMTSFRQGGKMDKKTYGQFLSYSEKVEQVCNTLLEQNENDSKAQFYKGGIIGYRGLLRFMNNEDLMKAVWDGKDAYNLLSDAVENDPKNSDAQFGLGLFNYLLTQAPNWVKPYIRMAGLKGDRVQGLKQMENAAANGIYSRSEARRWLSNFYAGLDGYEPRGAAHLKILADQYNQSWFLRSQLAQYYSGNLRRMDDAIVQYQKLYSTAQYARVITPMEVSAMASSGLGYCYYNKNNYDSSLKYYQRVLNEFSDPDFVPQAQYYCGLIYELRGNRTTALEYYKKIKEPSDDVKERLAKPLSDDERLVYRVLNFFRAGEYANTIAEAEKVLASVKDNTLRSEALYYSARAVQEQKQWSNAEERYWSAIKESTDAKSWVKPMCYLRIGQVQIKQNKKSLAKENLETAKKFSGYESENFVKKTAERELDLLD
jgi:tetratricopeptide (TPR) repeat protein